MNFDPPDSAIAWAIKIEYDDPRWNGPVLKWIRPEQGDGKSFYTTTSLARSNKFKTREAAEQYAANAVLLSPELLGKVHVVKILANWLDAHGIGLHGGWTEAK